VSLPQLNFPGYHFRFRRENNLPEIFDDVRKRWTALTPEEWVRQHAVRWLTGEKKYPASLLAVEKNITVNGLTKRCDVVAFSRDAHPLLIIECKAPGVEITQAAFDQVARYNMTLGVPLFMLTNGLRHFCCTVDRERESYVFIKELPLFPGE
jgi:type I site-specific restriction endonuclease